MIHDDDTVKDDHARMCAVMIHTSSCSLKDEHARMCDVMIHTSSCSCKDV